MLRNVMDLPEAIAPVFRAMAALANQIQVPQWRT
jgi:hypothetical protein